MEVVESKYLTDLLKLSLNILAEWEGLAFFYVCGINWPLFFSYTLLCLFFDTTSFTFYTHFIILVFRVLFDIVAIFSPSFDPRFVVSELYPFGSLALTFSRLSRTNLIVNSKLLVNSVHRASPLFLYV